MGSFIGGLGSLSDSCILAEDDEYQNLQIAWQYQNIYYAEQWLVLKNARTDVLLNEMRRRKKKFLLIFYIKDDKKSFSINNVYNGGWLINESEKARNNYNPTDYNINYTKTNLQRMRYYFLDEFEHLREIGIKSMYAQNSSIEGGSNDYPLVQYIALENCMFSDMQQTNPDPNHGGDYSIKSRIDMSNRLVILPTNTSHQKTASGTITDSYTFTDIGKCGKFIFAAI